MHGWQSKSIDGPKGGRSCAFRGGCGCSGHLNHNCWMQCGVEVVQGIICSCSCSCSCIVVVAVVDLVVVVMLQLQLQLQQPLQSQLQLQLQLQWWRSVLKCGEVVCVRSIVGLQLQLQLQLYCSEFVVLCSVARLNVQKCSERGVFCKCQFFALLTSKSASRHNGLHFLNISTSKGALNVVCFVHVDFKIYFAPQRRALFQHLNFQKCSGREVLLSFSLPNVLRATTACNFSSLICQMAPRPPLQRAYFSTLRSHKSFEKRSESRLPFRAPASSFLRLFLFSDLLSSSLL